MEKGILQPRSCARVVTRCLDERDLHRFYELRIEALTNELECFGSDLSDWTDLTISALKERLLTPPGSFVLGAFEDELCGFVCFHPKTPSTCAHKGIAWGMYVRPQSRKNGIGSLLLTRLREECLNRGFDAVNLSQSLAF